MGKPAGKRGAPRSKKYKDDPQRQGFLSKRRMAEGRKGRGQDFNFVFGGEMIIDEYGNIVRRAPKKVKKDPEGFTGLIMRAITKSYPISEMVEDYRVLGKLDNEKLRKCFEEEKRK